MKREMQRRMSCFASPFVLPVWFDVIIIENSTGRNEEIMMNNIMQKIIQKVTQGAVTAAVDKAIVKRARKVAQEDGRGWNGNFQSMVSGYYTGLSLQYLGTVLVVILVVSMAGMWFTGDREDLWVFFTITVLFVIIMVIVKRRMRVIVYWAGGIMFLDRKGNEIIQMPSQALYQAVIRPSKIIIPWEGKKYIIYRNIQDNEQDVKKMLAFYRLE